MKHLLLRTSMLVVAFMFIGLFALQAQQYHQLPVDKDVRIGRLPNGLTYYIRHNAEPKGLADFYIAQKVGSILEEENQRGLAHFLEHMCFNGTTNFPGNSLIEWLEGIGVKFGQNLNAYTAVDRTVYNISNVPVASKSVQDSCLLILHDWANDLLLDTEEINKERGVIHEEWRQSMVGQMRILENLLPIMYQNERYGSRLPIGIMEVVDNFDPQALRDYYETWYRPDQQGVIVVGDIDVDYIEGKIKEMFSSIEMPENPKPRIYFPVSDNKGIIYAIGSDKEQSVGVIDLMYKNDATPDSLKSTLENMINDYKAYMAVVMLNSRLADMTSNPETPFAQAGASNGDFFLSKTKNAFTLTTVAKGNDILPGFESVYRELLRAVRGGFTQSEYDRMKSNYLSSIETAYNNRDKRQSSTFVNQYVEHFLDNKPIPEIGYEYEAMKKIICETSLEEINATLKSLIHDDNRVLMVLAPDNGRFKIPAEQQIAAVIAAVDAENIEPYVDEVKSEPLIPNLPTPGKIVAETHNDRWDATEWTLSNGVKVIVKPTDFKKEEVIFRAVATGGLASEPDSKAASIMLLPNAISQGGLGNYNSNELSKYLAGKQAGFGYSFGTYDRAVSGSSTPRDLPTAMELLYMAFTDPALTEAEYEAFCKSMRSSLHNRESDPKYIFMRDLQKSSFKSPRRHAMTVETIDNANREEILNITRRMLANAADYTFVFVGTIDLDTFRPLVEQYIATLPVDSGKSISQIKLNPDFIMKKGMTQDNFTTKMENPQTWVFLNRFGEIPFTAKNSFVSFIAGEILGNRLRAKVREEMGAVYSIGASASVSRIGDQASVSSSFPMKPEMKKEVLDYIAQEIQNMTTDVKSDEVAKQVEFIVKNLNANRDKNGTWLNAIASYLLRPVDTFNGAVEAAQSITPADIQNFMKQLIKQENYRVVTLDPAE